MATANPYFLYPFGVGGSPSDLVSIQNQGGTTGPMSYQYGFTPNYEEDLSTIPSALPVPRPQFNQLMFDITTALQILQKQGAPAWVAPAVGAAQGGPANYPLFARVSYTAGAPYGFQIWESQVASNTSIPGTNNDWIIVSGARGNAAGTYIDSASPNGYPGALLCDGSTYLRADYPLLFQALTYTASCVTNSTTTVSVPPDVIALVSAYLPTGGNNSRCFVEGDSITTGTFITAVGSTTITLNVAALSSGTFTLRFLPYGYGPGGILITNFSVPDTTRRVLMGSGGSGSTVIGNKLANTNPTSDESYFIKLSDMVNHTHDYTYVDQGTALDFGFAQGTSKVTKTGTTKGMNGYPLNQTACNIVQPSIVSFRYVKY